MFGYLFSCNLFLSLVFFFFVIFIIIIIIICYRKPDPSSFAAIGVFPPFSFTHFIPLSLPAFVGVRPRENRQRNRK